MTRRFLTASFEVSPQLVADLAAWSDAAHRQRHRVSPAQQRGPSAFLAKRPRDEPRVSSRGGRLETAHRTQECSIFVAEVNHEPVGQDDLRLLAFGNYGHYTSMQVRQRAVRGLDLHLSRLSSNAIAMFGQAPSAGRVQAALRHAVSTEDACSVRVTLFSRDLNAVSLGESVEPEIMVTVTAPAEAQHDAFRVLPVTYEREMPHIKHLATYGLFRRVRQARLAGYDDADRKSVV